MARVSIVLALLLAVAAAQVPWIAFNGGGSRTGINHNETLISRASVASLALKWSAVISTDADPIDSSPVFWPNVPLPNGGEANMLFVNSLLGTLYALNADRCVMQSSGP